MAKTMDYHCIDELGTCGKSNNKKSPTFFDGVASKIEERRCDLINRQRYLKAKINTMEYSIPALMAHNMWTIGQNNTESPYLKLRELMKKLAPHSDPVEELLNKLKTNVMELDKETAEFHDKIIQADVQLEETEMKLESLELMNQELEIKLQDLNNQIRSNETSSLHSIDSQDLMCLKKICQLAKDELNLKNHIKNLGNKELVLAGRMEYILSSKEIQNINKKDKKANKCSEIIMKNRLRKLPCPSFKSNGTKYQTHPESTSRHKNTTSKKFQNNSSDGIQNMPRGSHKTCCSQSWWKISNPSPNKLPSMPIESVTGKSQCICNRNNHGQKYAAHQPEIICDCSSQESINGLHETSHSTSEITSSDEEFHECCGCEGCHPDSELSSLTN